jgi:hypothetical protein
MAKETLKKPTRPIETEPPKHVTRADVISSDGFTIVVDGIFKNEFESDAAARKAARGLLDKYPMLRVEIYDASKKVRTPVE